MLGTIRGPNACRGGSCRVEVSPRSSSLILCNYVQGQGVLEGRSIISLCNKMIFKFKESYVCNYYELKSHTKREKMNQRDMDLT